MAEADLRPPTLGELGTKQLSALAQTFDALAPSLPDMIKIFTRLLGAAAAAPSGGAPAYPSDVVDDHTPYELSFTVGGAVPEVRLLAETTDGTDEESVSLAGRWGAARAAGRWLAAEYGADLSRLDRIADLFEPRGDAALLALWHAVAFRPGRPPEVKVYLDLRARGPENARALLEEALSRLGLATAYPRLMREAGARGESLDELVYFSLDLAAHDRARVKVYFRHHGATAMDAERAIGRFGGVEKGEVRAFCAATLGGDGPYVQRPLVSCWSFTGGTADPTGATLYAPIAYYVRDDEEAKTRVQRWLERQQIPTAPYARGLAAFANRSLGAGVGMHSYVSFKREQGAPKLTCYLAPEAHAVVPPHGLAARALPAPRRPTTPEDMVRWYETTERVTDHPLFRRLEREPAAVAPLWAILANNWVAVGDHFPRWLAKLVARVEDDRVRSVLAKQLDDELGHGDPARAHRVLFQQMLADLEPYAMTGVRAPLMEPGRRFALGLARNYLEKPELEAIGGTLVAEVYGKQVDQRIGDLLRRQRDVDPASLTWLALHETLEIEHADESLELAGMTPRDPASMAAVCRGAESLATLGYRYFDDLYAVLFP